MKLYQKNRTSKPILNNTYYDDSGRMVYKVYTSDRTTTILKYLPNSPEFNDIDSTTRIKCDDDNAEEENSDEKTLIADDEEPESKWQGTHGGLGDEDEDGALSFIYLAQIDWKASRDHVIRFGDGRQVEATKFLKRDKWRERTFTASDGVEYKWIMGLTTSEATKYHSRKLGLFTSKPTAAHLEISPSDSHNADDIFTTFIYVERIRQDGETSTVENNDETRHINVQTDVNLGNIIERREPQDPESFITRESGERGEQKKIVNVPTAIDDDVYRDPRLVFSFGVNPGNV
ncbi:hypothetical protein VKT23_008392 [Stygiomarasmius scandens]|uniref:DUF6593 domain-containing protein n=1 Tax=Marasmiellus scandens TaxID=2682957 RepID=A0ABR1JPA5_9AGAR